MKSIYRNTVKMSLLLITLLNSVFAVAQYRPNDAAAYADQWATNGTSQGSKYDGSDPAYHNPAYLWYSADCANFVSQCLIEGGLTLSGCGIDNKGCMYNCDDLDVYLRDVVGATYERRGRNQTNTSGYSSTYCQKGDVVIYGDVDPNNRGYLRGCQNLSGIDYWQHAVIAVNNTPQYNAHNANRYHRSITGAYSSTNTGNGFRVANFYHIPSSPYTPPVSQTPPTLTITIQNASFTNNNMLIHSGHYNNEEAILSVDNHGVGNRSNIEVIYKGITGEPAYSDNDPQAYYNGAHYTEMPKI
jgi:hypothetical protein